MKEIPLSANKKCANRGKYVAIVSDEDYEWALQFNWIAEVNYKSNRCYVRAKRKLVTHDGRKDIYMHREIWSRVNGLIPKNYQIDHHKHGDFGALDNRRENLRLANQSLQNANKRKCQGTSSKFKGVRYDKRCTNRPWQAFIKNDGRWVGLGNFAEELEAAVAYNVAAVQHFGEFAYLNEI
jgi:hypothetical protein